MGMGRVGVVGAGELEELLGGASLPNDLVTEGTLTLGKKEQKFEK